MKDCGIVKDLLPLVAEELASEESTAFVEEHLKTCADCRAAFDAMKAPVEAEPAAPLKTVRKAVKRRGLMIAGLIACLVAALIFGAFARLTKPIPVSSSNEAFGLVDIQQKRVEIVEGKDIVLENVSVSSDDKAQGDTSVAETVTASIVLGPDDTITFTLDSAVPGTYHVQPNENSGQTAAEPEIVGIPKRLILLADPSVEKISIERTGGELFVGAYTTLWRQWFEQNRKSEQAQIPLTDVDVVFFEPYDNTDHEILYQRDGYTPEAGFALPRLVLNYYFLIALAGTAILALVWFVLRLTKKEKARRVFGVLLLIAGSFVLAFLAAGFPATTIAPVRELMFVLVIALLLIGAGLCGRKLLRKE